jgi:hypothetical protein
MCFEIKNKVALISGGASGIGLNYAKVLLRNELRVGTVKILVHFLIIKLGCYLS